MTARMLISQRRHFASIGCAQRLHGWTWLRTASAHSLTHTSADPPPPSRPPRSRSRRSAFLASDNIITHLLARHFPELHAGYGLMGVDTLHVFPETLAVAAEVEAAYGKRVSWFKPTGLATRAEFEVRAPPVFGLPRAQRRGQCAAPGRGRGREASPTPHCGLTLPPPSPLPPPPPTRAPPTPRAGQARHQRHLPRRQAVARRL